MSCAEIDACSEESEDTDSEGAKGAADVSETPRPRRISARRMEAKSGSESRVTTSNVRGS